MDRKNIWILGGAIVLGFLAFGLSQSWAQRFPGDGRVGGGENMVGRFQVVRSSTEAVLLLDTVTGELYSAGRDDIRPTSARVRGGDMAAAEDSRTRRISGSESHSRRSRTKGISRTPPHLKTEKTLRLISRTRNDEIEVHRRAVQRRLPGRHSTRQLTLLGSPF